LRDVPAKDLEIAPRKRHIPREQRGSAGWTQRKSSDVLIRNPDADVGVVAGGGALLD